MKHFLRLFLLSLLMPILSACGGSDAPEAPNQHRGPQKTRTVNLYLGGDFIEESDLPLTRDGENKTYIAINVSTKKSGDNSYQYYAYGLFDDRTKMQLDLIEGYYYQFTATTLSSSTDIYRPSNGQLDRPFKCNNHDGMSNVLFRENEMNKFIYHSSAHFITINEGTASVITPGSNVSQKYRFPRVNRYYGKLEDVYFSSSTKAIEIPVLRKNFGIHISAIGLADGATLSWEHVNPPGSTSDQGSAYMQFSSNSFVGNGENKDWEDIYSLFHLPDGSTESNLELKFTLQRNSIIETYRFNFIPQPNEMKVIKLDFNKQTNNSGVNISVKEEEGEMGRSESEHIWN